VYCVSGILFRMGLAMGVRCVTDSVRLYRATVQLVSVQQAKHCVLYCVILIWCCGSMSCVLCEWYTVQNGPGDGCALCDG